MSNYPPGMSRRDYDHVEGVSRCHCGAVLPEEVPCPACNGTGWKVEDQKCSVCGGTGKVPFEGEECPEGCLDEPDPDRQRDEQWDRDHDPQGEAMEHGAGGGDPDVGY